jgi:hypothetical protein
MRFEALGGRLSSCLVDSDARDEQVLASLVCDPGFGPGSPVVAIESVSCSTDAGSVATDGVTHRVFPEFAGLSLS